MKITPIHISLGVLALFSIACGGGGDILGIGGGDTIELSASRQSIAWSETSTIRWNTNNVDRILESNFGPRNGDPLNSEITDKLGITTTYWMEVRDEDYARHEDEVTVVVQPGVRKFLLVASVANSETDQIKTDLQKITTQSVDVAAELPANSGAFDCAVLHASGTLTPADNARVQTWLNEGKGIVVLGKAARLIATGNTSNSNTSTIGSWFGGVNGTGPWVDDSVLNIETEIPLSNVLRYAGGAGSISSPYGIDCTNTGPNAILIVGNEGNHSSAFGYKPSGGGKVFFTATPFGSSAAGWWDEIFQCGARWAAE